MAVMWEPVREGEWREQLLGHLRERLRERPGGRFVGLMDEMLPQVEQFGWSMIQGLWEGLKW